MTVARATASGQRDPEAQLRRRRQDRHDVRADRIEPHVPERDLAGEPHEDVEADADDRRQRHRRHDENVVAVGDRGERQRGAEDHGDREECERPHTFFTSARPKSPFGISASTTITSVNVTIWV